jgi:tetratricopeptide (TPR) repeat protein
MRTLVIAGLLLASAPAWADADADGRRAAALLEQARVAEAALDLPATRTALEELRGLRPDDVEVLLLLARTYADLGLYTEDGAEQRRFAELGLAASTHATTLAPTNSYAHLGVARALGKLAQLETDSAKRIDLVWQVQEAAQRALQLDPSNDYAWHTIGRLQTEIAEQGRLTRALAGLFVRSLPPASLEEAERAFRRSVELRPDRLSHRLELAMVLAERGNTAEARPLLEQGLAEPPREPHDRHVQEKARRVLDALDARAAPRSPRRG